VEKPIAFAHGFMLALGLVLPLGVQNVFVFSQGACQPKLRRALPAVIAAGYCDTLLVLLAVFGVSVAVLEFVWLRVALLAAITLACVLVSWLWFVFIAVAGSAVRRLDSSGAALRILNKASAIIMWASGLFLLHSLGAAL